VADVRYSEEVRDVDWVRLKEVLAADRFDNGRTPDELRRSFEASRFVVFAWDGDRIIGTARLLTDGVCNAYLVDVWTLSPYRRRWIGRAMVERLLARVPGHHVVLFTEREAHFYEELGFREERVGMSKVVGTWLNRPPEGGSAGG
jgi:GNAT superfamily N-acetyltransferase